MTSISISKLKINPSKAVLQATEYPIAIQNRNQTKAYLIGKDIYEKLITFMEDYIDKQAIENDDLTKEHDFEEVAKKLGL